MARKKVVELSLTERAYIKEVCDHKGVHAISQELGIEPALVESFIATLPKKDLYIRKDGVTMMSEGQSKADDAAVAGSQKDAFLKVNQKNVHIIDPSKPIAP